MENQEGHLKITKNTLSETTKTNQLKNNNHKSKSKNNNNSNDVDINTTSTSRR